MKKINSQFCKVLLSGILLSTVTVQSNKAAAQESATSQNVLKGRVIDSKGVPVSYSVIGLKGTTLGTTADDNGFFTLSLPQGTNSGDVVISSIGFITQEIHFDGSKDIAVTLATGAKNLNETVVIGYGTAKSKDLTGSVATVSERDFNEGVISTPGELIQGKVPGVVVTPNSGMPGAGTTINIRGIGSINQGTAPLIVLDGVPLSGNSISGASDPLSTLNPDDIESFTILKDAASTAIYGDRGANGVVLITTKHGKTGKLRVELSSTTSLATITGYTNVMNASQFRSYITANGTPDQIALLGKANTDWQKQIYQNGLTTNNSVTITGGIKNLPYRLSVGNFDQEGTLKTGYLKRQSVGFNLSPTFLNNSLKLTVNVDATHSENRFANGAAIGDAIRFDPTQPIYSGNKAFGGYYAWLTGANPNTLATSNPVADLNDKRDISGVNRGIGNVQLEYALPSFPELRAVVNLGEDISEGNGYTTVSPSFAGSYFSGGSYDTYKQYNRSDLLDAYLNYKKEFKNIFSVIDATAGYGYQDFITDAPATTTTFQPSPLGAQTAPVTGLPDSTKAVLVSYYARLNYTFHDKYLLSLSDREDYTSRVVSPHGGNFYAAAVGWKINEENFLKNSKAVSQLKLRASYGLNGNANIADYQYIPNYSLYTSNAQYPLGATNYIPLAPGAYNTNIKWETVKGANIGLDYGFFNNRLSGTIDVYDKQTSGLLLYAPVAALANLSNEVTQNIGALYNKGVEVSVTGIPISTKDITWRINVNAAYNKNEVTALYGASSILQTGGISGGTANTIQANLVGQPVNAFYAYQQVYAANGAPVEGLYVTQKNGSQLYSYKSPAPTTTLGFSTNFNYKKWGLFVAMHGDFGNYVYNNVLSNLDTKNAFVNSLGFLSNGSSDVLHTKFANSQYISDYYIQNASFLRMDNIALSYNFGKVIAKKIGITLTATCQNVFVITKYTGLNPEVNGGIDNNVYPLPRVYSLGIKLSF
jgi:iron complex outermembrane receptor protein